MVSEFASLESTIRYPSERYSCWAKFFRSTLRLIRRMPADRASAARARNRARPAPRPRQFAATPMVSSGTPGATKPYPGSVAGRKRSQAAPTGTPSASAITPRSVSRGQPAM